MLLGRKIVQANDLYTFWEHVNIEKYCDCNLCNRREFAFCLWPPYTFIYDFNCHTPKTKNKGESTKLHKSYCN